MAANQHIHEQAGLGCSSFECAILGIILALMGAEKLLDEACNLSGNDVIFYLAFLTLLHC